MDARLPTEIWVSALLRRCTAQGTGAYVAHKGAPAGGLVLLKILQKDRAYRVLSQSRDLDGVMGWLAAFDGTAVDEPAADAYIQRSLSRDPDLWVIETEGAVDLDGKIF
jgi:hypothetical protein